LKPQEVKGMNRACLMAGILVAGLVASACGGASPTAPETAVVETAASGEQMIFTASRVTKFPIAGTIAYDGEDEPGRELIDCDGKYHFWDGPVHTIFDGDVSGKVTFQEKGIIKPDGSGVFSGPFEGTVTWNDTSGTISGQFATNCKVDSSTGISCDGVLNARGSGGLEGVRFKFVWGPGFYPFPYTGTAYVK